MIKSPEKYFLPQYVLEGFVIAEPSRMTKKSSLDLISHWMERIDADLEPFRFKDQNPKVPFQKYSRSRKSSESTNLVDLDSSDDEPRKKANSSVTATVKTSAPSIADETPPTSDADTEDEEEQPTPKAKSVIPPRPLPRMVKHNLEVTPKPRKIAPKGIAEPKPRIAEPIEPRLFSSGDESDDSIQVMKIGPPKKAQKLSSPAEPKKVETVMIPPMYYESICENEPLLEEDENQPIALTGPKLNGGSVLTRYRFLRTLSKLKPYQALIKDIRSLPLGFITGPERGKLLDWANWDQREHCIPREIHMDSKKYIEFLNWMMEEPYRYSSGKLMMRSASEHIAIAIGMTLRDLHLRDHVHKSRTNLYPAFINDSKIPLSDIEDYFMLFCEAFSNTIKARKFSNPHEDPHAGATRTNPPPNPPKQSSSRSRTSESRAVHPKPAEATSITEPDSSEPNTPSTKDLSDRDDNFANPKLTEWKERSEVKADQNPKKVLKPVPAPPPRPNNAIGRKPPTSEELVIRTRAQAELEAKRKGTWKRRAELDEISEPTPPRKHTRSASQAESSVATRSPRSPRKRRR
jgi:hypothetical protein